MMRTSIGGKEITRVRQWRTFFISLRIPITVTVIVLLAGGAIGILISSMVSRALSAANAATVGGVLGAFTASALWAAVIGTIMMAIILVLRQDELAATLVIAIHLYLDWYLDLRVVALIMVLVLLCVFFVAQSLQHPWAEPRALWLWGLLLVLAIYPAVHGTLSLYDTLFYYPNLFIGAFIIFWLGTVVARNTASVLCLFKMLAAFGVLLALHAIIQAMTGTFLLASSNLASSYMDTTYYFYQLGGSDVHRLGSFFIDPNWNGTFFAIVLFIPLGLFAQSPSSLEKVLYLIETVLILLALLFTYSAGAWAASIAGLIAFITFVGRTRYRVQILLFVVVVALMLVVWFPSQVNYLLLHASDPNELLLRNGAWQTAWRVILAFPLTGVGLSIIGYAQRVEPYRVPEQYAPLAHPHNSYLELGAMAGLPVLLVFVALILFALWLALRNWAIADVRARSLLAGGIAAVIVLSFNSVTINAWTLPPLAAIGWLILGTISSPLVARSLRSEKQLENSNSTTSHSL